VAIKPKTLKDVVCYCATLQTEPFDALQRFLLLFRGIASALRRILRRCGGTGDDPKGYKGERTA
jgi:hypothetical protein